MKKCIKVRLLSSIVLALGSLASSAYAEGEKGGVAGEVAAAPAKLRAGVIVYLEKVSGPFRPPAEPVLMDQKGLQFLPRVLPVLRGTTVAFRNSDAVRHNVFTPDGDKYDLGSWPTGESKTFTFSKSGVYRQLCKVHPEMAAFIVVLDNPFFVVTDEAGRFSLQNVPPGSYTVKTWSEKLAPASAAVTVEAGKVAPLKLALVRP